MSGCELASEANSPFGFAPFSGDTKAIYNKSHKAAQAIIDSYCEETGIKNKGISYRSDLTGFNFSTVPAM